MSTHPTFQPRLTAGNITQLFRFLDEEIAREKEELNQLPGFISGVEYARAAMERMWISATVVSEIANSNYFAQAVAQEAAETAEPAEGDSATTATVRALLAASVELDALDQLPEDERAAAYNDLVVTARQLDNRLNRLLGGGEDE